ACLMGNMYHFSGHFWAVWLPIIIYLPLHIATFIEMRRINKGAALNRILGKTARNIFIYGLAVAIGLML
ncbi:MAG: 1,4-dihydroxy-2-naphthoate octaprenyltransferase, partial [Prevotella sp.]|nr:1,4-dihydroxy-2-naphthoate octaprenyltransferase [Prevotella sp.]